MKALVDHFRGKPYNDTVIVEFCNLNKLEYIPSADDLGDLIYQQEHDEKMVVLFKAILAELQNLAYIPELAGKKERKALVDANDEVRVRITKLFEDHGVAFKMVDKVANELGGMVGRIIESAGTTAFNKTMDVLMHIAREKFNAKELTLTHVRDYAVEVFEKHHAEKKENSASELPSNEVPTPDNSGEPQEENSSGDR